MRHLLAISWLILSQTDYTLGKICQDQQLVPAELEMYSPCENIFANIEIPELGNLATNTTSTFEQDEEPEAPAETP